MERRQGFTLLELMIIVTIVSTLASLVVPRLMSWRDRGFAATMRADLRNLATFEESYYHDHGSYSNDIGDVVGLGFQRSGPVSITIVEASVTGWSAQANHANSNTECTIYVGDAAPLGAASEQGAVACQ